MVRDETARISGEPAVVQRLVELDEAWPALACAGVLVCVLTMFGRTTGAMIGVWSSSGTYAHCYLVFPAFIVLCWQRRQMLSAAVAAPLPLMLCVVAVLGIVWLVGDLAAGNVVTQSAMIALVPALLATIFGLRFVQTIALPLAFLMLAVPFGEALVPYMMQLTADVTIALLRLCGIPVIREGFHFTIPSGAWSVVEACSGARYLFGCLAVASLFSAVAFDSVWLKSKFIAFAIATAILANWLRAFFIVVLGHLSDNDLAAGVDHLIYGTVFFVMISGIVLTIGLRWRAAETPASAWRPEHAQLPAGRCRTVVASAAIAVCAAWPIAAKLLTVATTEPALPRITLQPLNGWVPVSSTRPLPLPEFRGAVATAAMTLAKGGRSVVLVVGVYGRPAPQAKIANVGFRADRMTSEAWRLLESRTSAANAAGRPYVESQWSAPSGKLHSRHWFWTPGGATTSATRAVLAQLDARLTRSSEVACWFGIYTLADQASAEALDAFREDVVVPLQDGLQASLRHGV